MHCFRCSSVPSLFYNSLKNALTGWILLICCIFTIPAEAQVYDVAADFSLNSNPKGVWSYGYSTSLSSPFLLFSKGSDHFQDINLSVWQNESDSNLGVFKNVAGPEITGDTSIAVGELTMHPGRTGQYCKIIWTAPADGLYLLSVQFRLNAPGQTDVHLFIKGGEVINTVLSAKLATAPYNSKPIRFAPGETVVFAVGDGNNGPAYDTTGLAARIRAIPAQSDANSGGSPAKAAEHTHHPASVTKIVVHPAPPRSTAVHRPVTKQTYHAVTRNAKPTSKPKPAPTVNRLHTKKVAPKP